MKLKQVERDIIKVLGCFELTSTEVRQDIKTQLGKTWCQKRVSSALRFLYKNRLVKKRMVQQTNKRNIWRAFYTLGGGE